MIIHCICSWATRIELRGSYQGPHGPIPKFYHENMLVSHCPNCGVRLTEILKGRRG